MPLIYSFVARDATVLAEYSAYTGNFNIVALQCLQRLNSPENKFTIACDNHTFNFSQHSGFTYLAVADEAFGRQIPFAFLERVRLEFEAKYADKGRTAAAHGLDSSFGPRLKSHMEYCEKNPDQFLQVAAVHKQVTEVRQVMLENVNKVLDRGQKLEVLDHSAQKLAVEAGVFREKAGMLRRQMWWQYCRIKLLVVFVVMVVAVVIFLIACYSGGNNCTARE